MKTTRKRLTGAVCTEDHGGPGNSATVYGHFGSQRTCVRVGTSDVWVHDLKPA